MAISNKKNPFASGIGTARYAWIHPDRPDTAFNADGEYKLQLIMDPKAAQNLSVILGGALKHISYADLRKCILRCDTSVLTENLLQSLIQYLPTPDQLNKLQEHSHQYDDLAEAEQFAISLADIKRYFYSHNFLPH